MPKQVENCEQEELETKCEQEHEELEREKCRWGEADTDTRRERGVQREREGQREKNIKRMKNKAE
jgi:hypothetical protein